jgi:hypothetical protein
MATYSDAGPVVRAARRRYQLRFPARCEQA